MSLCSYGQGRRESRGGTQQNNNIQAWYILPKQTKRAMHATTREKHELEFEHAVLDLSSSLLLNMIYLHNSHFSQRRPIATPGCFRHITRSG